MENFFWQLLVQFQKNYWSRFFAMSQKLRFWPKMAIFWPNLAKLGPKSNFLGQNEYSLLIFGPTFSAVLENFWSSFFAMSQKLILAKTGHFSARQAKFGQNDNFSQKKGSAIFSPLLSPNFMPSFGKILGAVSENNCVTNEQTHRRTDKDDIIEPVASLVQKE